MAPHDSAHEPQRWSEPSEQLGDEERPLLVDSTISERTPRIDIDEALHNGWIEMWY